VVSELSPGTSSSGTRHRRAALPDRYASFRARKTSGRFRDGDVLVAKATAPAWTPLFARAAGVVTDGGSLAAHASLVAREYGIPAVVATGDATARMHPGQLVTVDGSAGTITPHTPNPSPISGKC
jgi:phosphoenolpyruvate synthase/pyruvate phosphate dikinase